jgi:sigma-E factor negative regulatory protein RseC
MNEALDNTTDYSAPSLTEGIAQVVAVEGNLAWLVPESGSSCGGCSSAAACGSKGIGTVASRLEQRRFQMVNEMGLQVGERVVVGVSENAVLRASITAYAIPLAALLISGGVAQWMAGHDFITMGAMLAGLIFGLWLSRVRAGKLMERGELAPRFIRRARWGETCNLE